MTKQVHAHQVLNLIGRQLSPITLDQLRVEVAALFGADLIFINCHDERFTFDQMIDFMQRKQKMALHDGAVELNGPAICEHE